MVPFSDQVFYTHAGGWSGTMHAKSLVAGRRVLLIGLISNRQFCMHNDMLDACGHAQQCMKAEQPAFLTLSLGSIQGVHFVWLSYSRSVGKKATATMYNVPPFWLFNFTEFSKNTYKIRVSDFPISIVRLQCECFMVNGKAENLPRIVRIFF